MRIERGPVPAAAGLQGAEVEGRGPYPPAGAADPDLPRRRIFHHLPLVGIGMLNRESPLLIPLFFLIVNVGQAGKIFPSASTETSTPS